MILIENFAAGVNLDGTAGKGFFDLSSLVESNNISRRVLLIGLSLSTTASVMGAKIINPCIALAENKEDAVKGKGLYVSIEEIDVDSRFVMKGLTIVPHKWDLFMFAGRSGVSAPAFGVIDITVVTGQSGREF